MPPPENTEDLPSGPTGHALTRGAFTIINGIASGMGGACGVGLRFAARVELNGNAGNIEARFLGPGANSHMDDRLVEACVHRLASDIQAIDPDQVGARVETLSEIPASRGLKSSSAAANAILLAGLAALGRQMEPLEVVKMGVQCAIDASVTLTGAFDDAVATMFGGAVLTDNERRTIVKWSDIPSDLEVTFLVPDYKIQKDSLKREDFAPIHDQVQEAFDLARGGDVASAITLNGRAYAPIVGVDNTPADAALAAGAWAAGMTGTGPAIAVVHTASATEAVLAALAPFQGTIVRTRMSSSPGMVLSGEEYSLLREEIAGGDGNNG
ncbi:MAG: shikimate kinase [Candidatus Thermoplasmatota archaeon]|nr:shikimate kinase [Candidatus Thermoplasmatota archaeon]